MSGIFGYAQSIGEENNGNMEINPMLLWNRAYGRDGEEIYEGWNFGIGCCYEKLSDTAKRSNPVLKRNGKYAVIDALLYNREELLKKCGSREELSDEELLFSYIEGFGPDALSDVNGDFSGAIYDEQEKKLVLFRDHIGVRPLFYYVDEKRVAFSTDIRGIIALRQLDASVDEEWIYKTVAGYIAIGTEVTEFAHIFCVKPAGYITLSLAENEVKIEKNTYWTLGSKKIKLSSEAEYRNRLRELITDSVKRRLDAVSGTVGAELSGGLDSGVIDILIHRLGRECVYFSWSVDPKELPYAEGDERLVIADICKQEHITCNYGGRYMNLGADSSLGLSMQQTGVSVNQEEQPVFRYALPPYINAMTICETSEFINRNGARVVFTGHGGDEGVSHRCNAYEMFYHREYYHFLRHMWSTTHGQRFRVIKTLKNCRKNFRLAKEKFNQPFKNPFAAPQLLAADFTARFDEKNMPVSHFAYDPKEYIREGGSRNRLDNIALLGAYSGARYLVPYLDYRVADFAVSIPRHLYLKGNKNRYLFREAFKDLMPESLYTLRIKADNSRKNIEPDPDWYEKFARKKEEVVAKLDREYWKKYLNFEEIDAWLHRGKPSEEERFQEDCIMSCLFACATVQNLIEKSREV